MSRAVHIQLDLLSYGLSVLQIVMHKLLIHHNHAGRTRVIGVTERPAAKQRDSRGSKIAGSDDIIKRAALLVRRFIPLIFQVQKLTLAGPGCRQVGSRGNGLGTGKTS